MAMIDPLLIAYKFFKYPEAFLAIIPLMILVWMLLRKDWVKFSGEETTEEAVKGRKRMRWLVFGIRSLAVIALCIAVASYYVEREVLIEGEPYLRIIIDNSSSFAMYDQTVGPALAQEISKSIRVETTYVGDSDTSPLGDAILSSLTSDGNVLVITDGQSNRGADLGDVALYATRLNATLSAITLDPVQSDVRVSIRGPAKTLEGIENKYVVALNRVGNIGAVRIIVKVDGQVVADKVTSEEEVEVLKTFDGGYHRIEALVDTQDFFPQNNQFFKSVKVVPKPFVAFVSTESSPMQTLLSQVYEVTTDTNVPSDLTKFHAVVINNQNAEEISPDEVDRLIEFNSDGNGMLVIGGSNSFERGAYKDSRFEQMLPAYVAEAGKEEGDINVVLLIDISGSTGTAVAPGMAEAIHVNKAQAISVFGDLKAENKLGVVVFNAQGFVVEPMSYIFEKVGLVEKIARIKSGGGTLISAGLMTSIDLLKSTEGSKNIILISDGVTQLANTAFETATLAEKMGIKIYTVSVGARTNDFVLQKISEIAHGIFFKADQASKLKILFGDVEEGDKKTFGLTVLNENHFITEDLDLIAMISGYNPVVAKTTASLLVTTDIGDPVLTAWRYGLGRIAALTTDDGTRFAGDLLNRQNSALITRTMNWVIGDPDRKSERFVDIQDTEVDTPTKLIVKSPTTPSAEGVVFFRLDDDQYSATVVPQQTGFSSIMDAVFAVNYKDEYADLGQAERLEEVVRGTGGGFYEKEQVDDLIEAVKTRSKRAVVKKVFIRWPWIVAAIALFLLDVFTRRLYKNKRLYR